MKNKALTAVNVFSIMTAAAAFNILPDTIPVHYDIAGRADRFAPKSEIYFFPAVIILISVIFVLINRNSAKRIDLSPDEKSRKYSESNAKLAYIVCVAVVSMMFSLECVFAVIGYDGIGNIDSEPNDILISCVCVITGALFSFVGNLIPKMRMNETMGIRTSWSMKNEEVWARCQRMGGKAFFFGGIAVVLSGLIFHGIGAMTAMILIFTVILVICAEGSRRIYIKWESEQNSGS